MDRKEEVEFSIVDKIVGTVWRSIVIGAAYTLTTFYLGPLLTRQGIPFPELEKLGISKLWFLGASIMMGFVIGAISQIVHTSKPNHVLTWTVLLFLNPFAVSLESAVLAPDLLNAATIPAVMLVQFAAALVAALLITFLFASSSKQIFGSYIHRPWSSWTIRFSFCIGIVLLLYSLLSATDYHLINKLYYDNYQVTLELPDAAVIFAIQFMKALLIVLSLIPMIITIGATKRFIAVMSGISLVVLGAVSPFLQVSNLSMFLLLASSGKLFLQNFLIGLCAGFILGCPSKLEEEGISVTDYLRPILRQGLANTGRFFTQPLQWIHETKSETIADSTKASNEIPKNETAAKLLTPTENSSNVTSQEVNIDTISSSPPLEPSPSANELST
jgi:hypothetical protein